MRPTRLVCHGGVPGPVQSVEGRYQLEPKRLYAHLADVELVFDPGTDELYSNLGMGLLGHALERAADKPFDRLLKETVCDPLQLEGTAIGDTDQLSLATGYSSRIPRRPEQHSYLDGWRLPVVWLHRRRTWRNSWRLR